MASQDAILEIVNILETEIENYEIANDVYLKNKIIADAIGVTPSDVSRFRSAKCLLHLDKIIALIRFLCPEKECALMRKICLLTLNTNKLYIIREAMEYASTAHMLDVLLAIVKDQLVSENKENKELAKIYKIVYLYLDKSVSNDELLKQIESTVPTRNHARLLAKILKCYLLHYKKEFAHMERIFDEAELLLNTLDFEDDFILRSYKIRLIELKSVIALNVYSDLETARKLANQVIQSEICAVFKVHSYYTLGKSYLYDDYEKCMAYYQKYHDLLLLDGREDSAKIVRERDMIFAKIIHGHGLDANSPIDLSELGHWEARWGNRDKALELLSRAEKEQGESVYKFYYKALAERDPKLLFEALIKFINTGLKFYAHLVLKDLANFEDKTWEFVAKTTIDNIGIK